MDINPPPQNQNLSILLTTLTKESNMFKVFRVVAILEGLSYLFLLFGGVPLKYFGDNDILVKSLGMPHGMLFITYVILAIMLKPERKWDNKTFWKILVASILPFGTFYADKKYF